MNARRFRGGWLFRVFPAKWLTDSAPGAEPGAAACFGERGRTL